MENVPNVEPAGNDENTPTPDLTIDDVVALSETREQPARPEAETTQPNEPEPAPEPVTGQGEESNAEPDPFDWEKVPGTAKFRLRDGTAVTAAELKKHWDELQQVPKTKQELAAEKQRVQQAAAQSAQYAQFLNNVLPAVVQKAQALMPKRPEPPAYVEGDLVGNFEKKLAYDNEKEAYDRSVWEIQQLHNAQQVQQQRAAREQKEMFDAYLETEREKLHEALPELRDPAKATQFEREFQAYGQQLGFSPQEINSVYDHRIMVLAKEAMAYRKLKANPPKPVPQQKPAAAAPVAQPGRRVDGTEARQQARSELLQRARKQGGFDSIDDAMAAFSQLKR